MAGKPVKVAFLADTSELRSSLEKAEQSFTDTAAEAVRAGDKMDGALSGVADKADGVASASSQAAGGIGDLGGALSMIPGPLGALGTGMEVAAPAIMGVTGAADLLNLATAKFPALAKAQTVATNAVAAAQKALNFVMSMNPIGLVVAAIVVLIGIFVLLYKKNEGFRELVDKVWAKVKDVVSGVVAWFMDVAWPKIKNFAEKATASFVLFKDGVTDVVTRVRERVEAIKEKFGEIRTKVAEVVGTYSGGGGGALGKLWDLVDAIGGLKEKIGSKASGMWDGLKESFRSAINAMVGWWNNLQFSIDLPDKIPGLPDSFTIATPNIPYLAEGGVVTRPTLAVIGEAGPEAVIPLNGRYGLAGGVAHITLRLTAQEIDQLSRGRALQADLDAYAKAGGR